MAAYSTGIPDVLVESRDRTSASRLSTTPATGSSNTNGTLETPLLSQSTSPAAPTPRTCRICFESVLPEVNTKTGKTTYGSDRSEEGRLIRPCSCNGSQRYIHELCLRLHRHNHPLEDSYLRCPTCRAEYRFNDSLYTALAAHPLTHACLTATATCTAIYVAGYAVLPLLPLTVFSQTDRSWLEHFAQGTCMVGVGGWLVFSWDLFHLLRTFTTDLPMIFFFLFAISVPAAPGQGGLWIPIAAGTIRVMYWLWCDLRTWVRRFVENERARVVDLDDVRSE